MTAVPATDRTDMIPIAVGGYLASVVAPPGEAGPIRSMLQDMIRTPAGRRGARFDVRGDGTHMRISVDGRRWDAGVGQTTCDQLIYALMRATLDAAPELLHLHTAYVSLHGRGVLIAGPPGSGKSTLTARLVGAGFDYLTDERVGVDSGLGLTPLPKPVSLVQSSFAVLPHLDPVLTGAGAASTALWHVPASAIRPGSVTTAATPTAVVFVQYREGAGAELTPVHRAEAVRLLLSGSADARRLGPLAVDRAAALCASLRCARLAFGDDDEVVDRLEGLIAPSVGAPVPSIAPFRGTRPARGERPSRAKRHSPLSARSVLTACEGISGVVIEGRAVLRRARRGDIVELDEASTAWLQLLDGSTSIGRLAREVATANDLPEEQVSAMALRVLGKLSKLGVVA